MNTRYIMGEIKGTQLVSSDSYVDPIDIPESMMPPDTSGLFMAKVSHEENGPYGPFVLLKLEGLGSNLFETVLQTVKEHSPETEVVIIG